MGDLMVSPPAKQIELTNNNIVMLRVMLTGIHMSALIRCIFSIFGSR
jgi:hypothetical protein